VFDTFGLGNGVPEGGAGALPPLAQRFDRLVEATDVDLVALVRDGRLEVDEDLRSLP